MAVPYNQPMLTGAEFAYVEESIRHGQISGDGLFTHRVHAWLESNLGTAKALLTHSCTAALEMSALLADVEPGDEIIMPSFTFVSTANAFVLRGALPVFVDVRPDTLNIDEQLIEAAITERTRAICVVHYAGVACEMDAFVAVARRHGILLIEDAAQALGSTYRGRPLGTIGDLGALSFHETKNVISGEGGALLVNAPQFAERAEIIREKGTNRSKFLRGAVDKYTWVDLGSSYLPSDIIAAFLYAQLEHAPSLLARRLELWNAYHESLEPFEARGVLRRPIVPPHVEHNGHIYYVLLDKPETRDRVLEAMRAAGILAIFHYVPLHSAPAGLRYGRVSGNMHVTDDISARLLRLPIFYQLEEAQIDFVVKTLSASILGARPSAVA